MNTLVFEDIIQYGFRVISLGFAQCYLNHGVEAEGEHGKLRVVGACRAHLTEAATAKEVQGSVVGGSKIGVDVKG